MAAIKIGNYYITKNDPRFLLREIAELKNKQYEFIDWLENEIENCKYGEENYADGDDMTYHNENELRKEILSKYKEIIGGKE